MSQILAQISTPVVFEPPYFWTAALYWKTKTNLSRSDDRSTIIPKLEWVGPQLPEPLAQWVPQRVKVKNILYILHSSGPARVYRHQYYTTCWDSSWCKKSTVPDLPIHPLQFTGGGSPKRAKVVNFLYILRSNGPRLVYRHQCYTTYWGSSWCKKSIVPYLAIRPLHFTGGAKITPH